MFGEGKPLYVINHALQSGRILDGNEGIFLANVEHKDAATQLGRLMRDLGATNSEEVGDPHLKSALEKIETKWKEDHTMSKEMENMLDAREEKGRVEGREEGIEIGVEKGQKERTLSYARKGYISLSVAAKDLGMTEEEVQALLKDDPDSK